MSPTVSGTVADSQGNTASWSASWTTTSGQQGPPKTVAIYNSGNIPKMVVSGQQLNGGSGYLRTDQTIGGSTGLMSAINNGATSLFVTIDSKTNGPVWHPWSEYTAGTWDTNLLSFRSNAVSLLNAHPALTIYVSFVHEGNLRDATGTNPNKTASDTATTYRPASNHVADLMHGANHPRLKTIHWTTSLGSAVPYLPDKTKFDAISIDIYKVGDTNHAWTMSQLFAGFAQFCTDNGWTTQSRHVTETGIKTDQFSSQQQGEMQYTEAEQLAFWDSMSEAMADPTLNLSSIVWFEADGTNHDYRPQFPSIEPEFAQEAGIVINS